MTHHHTLTTTPDRDRQIRDAQRAVIARIERDPDRARSTLRTIGEIGDGLACTVTQGRFQTLMDLGPAMGGDSAGPSPGFFARAAIAGCVAIAVKMLAAREDLHLDRVAVAVETDFDDAALFGIGPGNAAPTETRITLEIDTHADPARIDEIVARALATDPWYLALRDPQRVRTSVSVTAPRP